MPVLDVYKARQHTIVRLNEQDYKIPNEYTVEEVERLLELGAKREAAQSEIVSSDTEVAREQLKRVYSLAFDQLEVVFQHYQPDITADDLRGLLSHKEALAILGFYDDYRLLQKKRLESSDVPASAESKKKVADRELRELRRMITFMVTCGFSLYDLRKLYIDELSVFHEELIFTLEKAGKIEAGTYDKVRSKSEGVEAENTVNLLRKQLFKTTIAKPKKR